MGGRLHQWNHLWRNGRSRIRGGAVLDSGAFGLESLKMIQTVCFQNAIYKLLENQSIIGSGRLD